MNHKRFSLRDRVKTLVALSPAPCSEKRSCALLQACLDGSIQRHGIAKEHFVSGDGQRSGTRIVLWIRGREYAELSYCPFCGGKIGGSSSSEV